MKLAFNLIVSRSLLSSGCMCLWEPVSLILSHLPSSTKLLFFFTGVYVQGDTRQRRETEYPRFKLTSLPDSGLEQKEVTPSASEGSKFFQKQMKPWLSSWQYSPFGSKHRGTVRKLWCGLGCFMLCRETPPGMLAVVKYADYFLGTQARCFKTSPEYLHVWQPLKSLHCVNLA